MLNEKEKQIETLREQVAHAEAHGQFDTAHHEMLRRLIMIPIDEHIGKQVSLKQSKKEKESING